MNPIELKVEMLRHGDIAKDLAAVLNITEPAFSNKLNNKGTEFTQGEIMLITERYALSPERIAEIFFSPKQS